MYHELPCVATKSMWAMPFSQSLADPNFKTGSDADNQRLLRDLIAFYVIFEGIFFYVGFSLSMDITFKNDLCCSIANSIFSTISSTVSLS